jgi:exopolysaccharide biosynthesis polyprenyl glycosylphosphotransferase
VLQRRFLALALKVFDQVVLGCAFVLSAAAVSDSFDLLSFSRFLAVRIKVMNFLLYVGFAFIWHGIFSALGLYCTRRFGKWGTEVKDLVHATSLGTFVLCCLCLLFDISFGSPPFLVLFWIYTTAATMLSRLGCRFLQEYFRRRGVGVQNILMVGTNPRAVRFARKIKAHPELGWRVVGFVDNQWVGTPQFLATGYPLVSDFAGFAEYLRRQVVDEVIIDLPLNSFYRQVQEIVRQCLEQGVMVRFLSDSFYLLRNMKLARTRFDEFEGEVLLSVETGPLAGWPLMAKRVFDFTAALLLLIILSPLLVLIALLIKLTSPGPVFFVQERLGLNKRVFRMYKFRTMTVDAEARQEELERFNEADGPVFKIRDDPRITPVGKWLRRTSLDELPQLFNVIMGDMSLVGPRPLPLRDYRGFNQDWHRRRFSVRPGLTCLWQINGRSELSFHSWMAMDMKYIDQWSFGLDLKILLRTIPAILKEKGAY